MADLGHDPALAMESVRDNLRQLLLRNSKEGCSRLLSRHYCYVAPALGTYPYQWFWDTCFNVIMLARLGEHELAKRNLHSLFEMQEDDGFVGHMIFWQRALPHQLSDVIQARPSLRTIRPHMSAMIQPCLAAQALLALFEACGDRVFLGELYAKVRRYHERRGPRHIRRGSGGRVCGHEEKLMNRTTQGATGSPKSSRDMVGRGAYRPDLQGPRFDPATTMLLVIDPVNDFLSDGGAGWEMTKSTVNAHDVIGHLRQAIDAARRKGISVIYGPMAYTQEDYASGKLQCHCGINRLMFEQKMFLAGSWGADFHPELKPTDGEIVLLPHKGTDVFETDLPQHLDRMGTTHLVIAGMTANLC